MVSYALSLCRLSTGCKINRFIHLQRALLAVQLCLCGLTLLLLLASSFPSFLFTRKRCEPLEINPSHWSERHIGISFFHMFCDILDGYHVCAETLVRCDPLLSDPSHHGDTAPNSTPTALHPTELNWTLTALNWTELLPLQPVHCFTYIYDASLFN